jgi:hypothetical protein
VTHDVTHYVARNRKVAIRISAVFLRSAAIIVLMASTPFFLTRIARAEGNRTVPSGIHTRMKAERKVQLTP